MSNVKGWQYCTKMGACLMLAHPIWECSHMHWRWFHPIQRWNDLSLKVSLWMLSVHSMMFQYGMAASRSATFPIEKPRHLLDDSFLESQSPVRHDPHTTFASNGLSLGMYTLCCIHGQNKDCLHRWGKREDNSRPDGSDIFQPHCFWERKHYKIFSLNTSLLKTKILDRNCRI